MGNVRGRIYRAVVVERTSFTNNPCRHSQLRCNYAKVEYFDEMDVDWDDTSDDENNRYE